MTAIAGKWNVDGIILHYNRGCEGLSAGIAENRLGLIELGNKVLAYEDNLDDGNEVNEDAMINRLALFMGSLGCKKTNK